MLLCGELLSGSFVTAGAASVGPTGRGLWLPGCLRATSPRLISPYLPLLAELLATSYYTMALTQAQQNNLDNHPSADNLDLDGHDIDEDVFLAQKLENGLLSFENPNYHLDPARLDDALNSNSGSSLYDELYQELVGGGEVTGGGGGVTRVQARRTYAALDLGSMGVDVTQGPLTQDSGEDVADNSENHNLRYSNEGVAEESTLVDDTLNGNPHVHVHGRADRSKGPTLPPQVSGSSLTDSVSSIGTLDPDLTERTIATLREKRLSTQTQMLKVTDDVRTAANNRLITIIVLLDFSKSIDSFGYHLLVKNHRVEHCTIVRVADCLQVYLHCSHKRINKGIAKVNDDIAKIYASNGLRLNAINSKAMILGSSRFVNSINWDTVSPLMANGVPIPLIHWGNRLGLMMEPSLKWRDHVNGICRKVHITLLRLRNCSDKLSRRIWKRLATSLVLEMCDYGYLILGDLTHRAGTRVQRALNIRVQYDSNVRIDAKILPYLRDIRRLKLDVRRQYFLACFLAIFLKKLPQHTARFLFTNLEPVSGANNCPAKTQRPNQNASRIAGPRHRLKSLSTGIRSSFFLRAAQAWVFDHCFTKNPSHYCEKSDNELEMGGIPHVEGGLNSDLYAIPVKRRQPKDQKDLPLQPNSDKQPSSGDIDAVDSEDKDGNLPPGWEKHEDNDGPYYWHIKSGTIQREPPEAQLPSKSESRRSLVKDNDSITTFHGISGMVNTVIRSNTSSALDQDLENKRKEDRALKRRSYPARVDTEGKDKRIRFAVRSLGWVPVAEEELTPDQSSKIVNKCILDLTLGKNDLLDVVGRWGDGKDLFMDLDQGALKLVDPENLTVLNTQPIHTIRVWGVGRDNGRRDFAYVARDRTTRRHMCHVFRCDILARTIANTLRDICKKIMIERSVHQNLAKPIDINGRTSLATRPTNLPTEHRRFHRNSQALVTQSFPTPMEEPKKVLRAQYLGSMQVSQASGMDVLNDAIDQMVTNTPNDQWRNVNVAVAPSMISILTANDDKLITECRVRYLSFLGIGRNVKQCAFIMHTAQDIFIAHAFNCEPSSGALCKTIEAACKLRYQKCLDAHPQGFRNASSLNTPGGRGLGATLKSLVGSFTGRRNKQGES